MISNLDYYKVFYYVAKCGSVTKAAEQLTISQPAVSQALKQLERNINATLLSRAPRGVKLTAEGELLYAYVSKGYEQIEQGVAQIRKMQNLELGEVHIGASDMTLQFYLLPFLEKFHEAYPEIKVNVTNGPTPETLQALKEGRIDFGVVSTPFDEEEGIHSTPVRDIEDIFVAGRKFMEYKNKMLNLKNLEKMPLIFLEGNTSTRSYMDSVMRQYGVELSPEFELATSDMIVQFAERNLGVGCVVRDFANEALESGKLFELRFRHMIPKRKMCVVRGEAELTAAAKKLLEIMSV